MRATINLRQDQYEIRFGSCKVGDNVELSRDCGLFMPALQQQRIEVREYDKEREDGQRNVELDGKPWAGRRLMLLVLSPSPISTNGYTVTNFGPAKCLVTEIFSNDGNLSESPS